MQFGLDPSADLLGRILLADLKRELRRPAPPSISPAVAANFDAAAPLLEAYSKLIPMPDTVANALAATSIHNDDEG